MHNQVYNNKLHISVPALLPGNTERTIRLLFFSKPNGSCTRSSHNSHTRLSEPGIAQPLLCPPSSPLNRYNIFSMFYLMAEVSFSLQTPPPLPESQLWSLINHYSAGNLRESDGEQSGYRINDKNADGENIIMNNIRLALNPEVVSPQPIKSPLSCASF